MQERASGCEPDDSGADDQDVVLAVHGRTISFTMISLLDPGQDVRRRARSTTGASATHPENDGYRIVVGAQPYAAGRHRRTAAVTVVGPPGELSI
jgi:hypothetical protein